MKKKLFTTTVIALVASSVMFTSCIGSFGLFNKVKNWNEQVGNKVVNELVFVAFWILPVYEISFIADILVLNSIEFWSGTNPVTASTTAIDTESGRYLVDCDKSGYTITSERDGSVVKLAFNEDEQSWAVEKDGQSITFMTFVDDNHVKMITPDGSFETIEISQSGLYAYRQLATAQNFALK